MALSVSVPTPYGIPATYWRIGVATADRRARVVSVVLHGFPNMEASASSSQPLAAVTECYITFEDLGLLPDGSLTWAMLYTGIKAAAAAAPTGTQIKLLDGATDC